MAATLMYIPSFFKRSSGPSLPLPNPGFALIERLQAKRIGYAKRNYEEDVLAILAQPEKCWEASCKDVGLRYGPRLKARLVHLKRSGFQKLALLRDHIPPRQSLVDFADMHETKESFDRLIKRHFTNLPLYRTGDNICLGTLELRELNAWISKVPKSDHFAIVLNRALWNSLKGLSYVLVATVLRGGGTRGAFDREQAARLVPLFVSMFNDIIAGQEPAVDLPDYVGGQGLTWALLDQGMHDFVLGHEYGHFLKGHTDNLGKSFRGMFKHDSREDNGLSWSIEYEADRVGLDLAVMRARYGNGKGWLRKVSRVLLRPHLMEMAWIGCWAALLLIAQMEKIGMRRYRVGMTHPPALLRAAMVFRAIRDQMPNERIADEKKKTLFQVAACIEFLFQFITKKNVTEIVRLEVEYQELVFLALTHVSHQAAIKMLESQAFAIVRMPCAVCDPAAMFPTLVLAYQKMSAAHSAGIVSTKEAEEMILRTVEILKKEVAALRLGRGAGDGGRLQRLSSLPEGNYRMVDGEFILEPSIESLYGPI